MPAPVEQTNGGPAPISSTDFFESIGKKATHLDSTNGTNGTNGSTNGANGATGDDDEKVVQEIESLCMNCHENVSNLFRGFKLLLNSHRTNTA